MNIEAWLSEFNKAWTSHDIDKVISLFVEDVEYWETPYKLLKSLEELRNEWQGVVLQSNIDLTTSLYSSVENKHTIIWHLQYLDQKQATQTRSGTYLVTLNKKGLCTYFHHTGEKL